MDSLQSLVPMKRLQDESLGETLEPPAKRHAPDAASHAASRNMSGSSQKAPAMSPEQLANAAKIITREFSTEILLKHNELRLIDTEIAKCQAALEQLRRVSIIPYPSQTGRVADMLNVSAGTGPALVPAGMQYPPTHPPPWGVTDGPYSRQYADWLIPAPEFDGGLNPRLHGSRTGVERRVRGQYEDPVMTSSRARGARGSNNSRLQALPLGYPQPKGSRGPLTLKRQSDSKWVKLVCQNCQREDFSSVQGFINHCRISHQVHFVTHEDAAQRAGTEEGVNQETGEVSGSSAVVQRPNNNSVGSSAANSSAPAGNSSSSSSNAVTCDSVHRFNRAAVNPRALFPPPHVAEEPPSAPSSFKRQREAPRRNSSMGPPISPGFVPSSATPHLSSLFAKTGRAGDLDALVREAKIKEDIETVASPRTPDGPEAVSPLLMARHPSKHQMQGALSGPSSASRKGLGRKTGSTPIAASLAGPRCDAAITPKCKSVSSSENSPSAMMDTNQAPSLVSDDGQSGSEGEEEDDRHGSGNHQQTEPQARISGFDGVDELLPHDQPDGPSTMEVEEKIRNWKQQGSPRPPPGKEQGSEMRARQM